MRDTGRGWLFRLQACSSISITCPQKLPFFHRSVIATSCIVNWPDMSGSINRLCSSQLTCVSIFHQYHSIYCCGFWGNLENKWYFVFIILLFQNCFGRLVPLSSHTLDRLAGFHNNRTDRDHAEYAGECQETDTHQRTVPGCLLLSFYLFFIHIL